jgi:translocation and assembly module TamB
VHLRGSAIAADKLALRVETEGRELRKVIEGIAFRGKYAVELAADGPADRLHVTVGVRPPKGALDVDAMLTAPTAAPGQPASTFDATIWRATVKARDLDPGAAVAEAPHGDVRLDASGRGTGTKGTIDLGALSASVAGTNVDAHGRLTTGGDADVTANVNARDLSRLRALVGLPDLAGSVSARAHLEKTTTHLHVDLDARGQGLRVGANQVGRMTVKVHEKDLIGTAQAILVGVHAGGATLDSVKLDASGDPRAVQARLTARGPEQTAIDLALHGTPQLERHRGGVEGKKITGADLQLTELTLARHGQRWAATGPARLHLDPKDGVRLEKLSLTSTGGQALTLAAHAGGKNGALEAQLGARKIDLRQVALLVKPSLDVPKTQLDLTARVRGTQKAPLADVSLDGYSERSQRLGLNRIDYHLKAHYGGERAKAELEIKAIDEQVQGTLDVPVVLTANRPIAVDVKATNVWMVKLHKVLPPQLANLQGRLDGSIHAGGTTGKPELAVRLHGKNWDLGDAKNSDVQVAVDYKERQLGAKVDVALMRTVSGDAGTVNATVALPLPLTLAELTRPGALMHTLRRKSNVRAEVTLGHIDLGRFPFAELGMAPPLSAGKLDGTLALSGTLHQPTLDARLDARGLGRGKLDRLDVVATAGYKERRATLGVDASLRGAPLLEVRGAVPIDVQRVLDGQPYRDTPVQVDARVPGYDLGKLADLVPGLAGKAQLDAKVRGTIAHPTGTLDAAVAALGLGAMKYDRFEARGGYDGTLAQARIDAHEVKGGSLHGDARVPMAAKAPMTVALDAQGFYIDLSNADLTNPRLVKGTLDAQLRANGPRTQPDVHGYLRFHDGQLALAEDPRIFTGVQVDVDIDPHAITLKNAEAHLADGNVKANGKVTLAGLEPETVQAKIYSHKLPIEPGTFGLWVDAEITVDGKATPDGLTGTVTVEKGTANLPKLAGGKSLQKVGPLEDVRFTDPRALRAEAKKRAKEAEDSGTALELRARIPGPFHVRSKEISTDLKGTLLVSVAGETSISGHVEASGGWIELLGRHYTIDKARVGFGGGEEIDPTLDIKLTRELSETMIVIEVHGTAKKPTLVLASDPPIYDQSQVIAAILSGDPATQRVDDRSLDQKVTGAISGLVVGKIKDQIAPNLPIDVIKVDTGSEGSTGLGDTRLEVGKYITDTVYVSYVHQFGSTMVGTERINSNEANLEWRFKKHYAIEGAFGDAAVGRVNFYWTIRY